METKATSCNPSLHIDLLETNWKLDKELLCSSIYFNLYLDTRVISWNGINKSMDLPYVHQQAHQTEKFEDVHEVMEIKIG